MTPSWTDTWRIRAPRQPVDSPPLSTGLTSCWACSVSTALDSVPIEHVLRLPACYCSLRLQWTGTAILGSSRLFLLAASDVTPSPAGASSATSCSSAGGGSGGNGINTQYLAILGFVLVGAIMIHLRRSRAAKLREAKLQENGLACVNLVNKTGVAVQVPAL
jgi:hypothetical protein